MGMAFTTWPATFGNGPQIGIRSTLPFRVHVARLTIRGAKVDESYDSRQPQIKIPRKVMKGGSFLCAPPITAAAIGRQHAWRRRSTPRLVTSAFAASPAQRRIFRQDRSLEFIFLVNESILFCGAKRSLLSSSKEFVFLNGSAEHSDFPTHRSSNNTSTIELSDCV
jgi:hypothetical protein